MYLARFNQAMLIVSSIDQASMTDPALYFISNNGKQSNQMSVGFRLDDSSYDVFTKDRGGGSIERTWTEFSLKGADFAAAMIALGGVTKYAAVGAEAIGVGKTFAGIRAVLSPGEALAMKTIGEKAPWSALGTGILGDVVSQTAAESILSKIDPRLGAAYGIISVFGGSSSSSHSISGRIAMIEDADGVTRAFIQSSDDIKGQLKKQFGDELEELADGSFKLGKNGAIVRIGKDIPEDFSGATFHSLDDSIRAATRKTGDRLVTAQTETGMLSGKYSGMSLDEAKKRGYESIDPSSNDFDYYYRVIDAFEANAMEKEIKLLKEGKRYAGHVYEPMINENRRSIDSLAKELEDVDLVIGTDRGGSTLAELLQMRYQKRSGIEIDIASVSKKIDTGNPSSRYRTLTRIQQDKILYENIENHIKTHPDTKSIAITESVISGGSANEIMNHVVRDLADKYPDIKIKLLLHQQTLGNSQDTLEKLVKRGNLLNNIEISIQESKFLIPEDVNLNSRQPLRVFKRTESGEIVRMTVDGDGNLKEKLLELLTQDAT